MSHADRDLLFGVLAVRQDLISPVQLADACALWASSEDRSLSNLLVERGWITSEDRDDVERVLNRHGGDVRAVLRAAADAMASETIRDDDDSVTCQAVGPLASTAGFVLVETSIRPSEQRSRYRLTRLHAEGGLGKVWVAHDDDLNREVALKEIRPEQAGYAEARRRFLKEAQVTGQLEHPGIVPVYELARRPDDGQPFYTMRFIRGRTMREAVADYHKHRADGPSDPLELSKLLQAFVSICQAVGYAHSRGVVHRDLKPDNVVLGGFGEVVVLDWGLAKMIDQPDETEPLPDVVLTDEAQSEVTRAGTRLGTPSYMAPEQAEGRLDLIDHRTDVYGLGAILFQVLTGSAPHKGRGLDKVLDRIMNGETPRARAIEPSVPRALDAICARAMAKKRPERYPSATVLAEDVQRWLADEPVSAFPEGGPPRLARWLRRNRAWSLAGLSTLLLTCVILGVAVLVVYRAEERERAERIRADKISKNEKILRGEAQRRLADIYLERGLAFSEQGDVGRGLLWMASGLMEVSSDDAEVQRPFRTNLHAWRPLAHTLQAAFEAPSPYRAVAFSPDRKLALTVGQATTPDRDVRLLDLATGEATGGPFGRGSPVGVVAFSPDGRLAFMGGDDKTSQLYQVANGEPAGPPLRHESRVLAVAFSPDGKQFATGGEDKAARLWDASTCQPIGQEFSHPARINVLAFRPDGKALLLGGEDGTSRLWEIATGNPISPPLVQAGPISASAFSPDRKLILTGSHDKTARLWDASTGKQVGSAQHDDRVLSVAFSPDGRRFVTGGMDRTARLWDTASGKPIGPPLPHLSPVIAVAFSTDGERLVVGGVGGIRHWLAAKPSVVGKPLPHDARVQSVAFSPDGTLALTGSFDTTVRLWEPATGEPLGPPLRHDGAVFSLKFSPDGKRLIVGAGNGGRLWDVGTRTPIGPPLRHGGRVISTAFSPDGRLALTGSLDNTAKLWDASNGKQVGPDLVQGEVYVAAFSPDSRLVATGGTEARTRLWDVTTGRQVGPPIEHRGWVRALAFSPDGRLMLIGTESLPIHFWSTETRRPVGQPLRHQSAVHSVAFSPDGKHAITGSMDGSAKVWDVATQDLIGRALDPGGPVNLVAFSPDGKLVLTGSFNKRVRFWNAATSQSVGPPLEHPGWVTSVAFSPDGTLVLTSSEENAARLWTVPPSVQGTPREILLECELATSLHVDKYNSISELSYEEWQEARRKLDRLKSPRALIENGSRIPEKAGLAKPVLDKIGSGQNTTRELLIDRFSGQ